MAEYHHQFPKPPESLRCENSFYKGLPKRSSILKICQWELEKGKPFCASFTREISPQKCGFSGHAHNISDPICVSHELCDTGKVIWSFQSIVLHHYEQGSNPTHMFCFLQSMWVMMQVGYLVIHWVRNK